MSRKEVGSVQSMEVGMGKGGSGGKQGRDLTQGGEEVDPDFETE